MSTLSVGPNTTITTLVTVPTAATANSSGSSGSSGSSNTGKLVGGLVGSIGGTIVIGVLVVLFIFFKKRSNRLTNQLPDFAEDSSLNEKLGSFKKLFGQKSSAGTGGAGVSGYNDLELQINYKSAAVAGGAAAAAQADADDDYEYRGVSNSNNLDSVFRLLRGLSTPQTSGHASVKTHSRYNSVYNPMEPMEPMSEHPGPEPMEHDLEMHEDPRDELVDVPYDDSPPYPEDEDMSPSSDSSLIFQDPQQTWTDGNHSNNSHLRFQEDI